MGKTLDVDSAIQPPILLITSSQGALFLPQMRIKTNTIVLENICTGKSVTIMIFKHPTNGMSVNCKKIAAFTVLVRNFLVKMTLRLF